MTVCRQIPETITKQVPVTTCRMVAEEVVKQVPVTVTPVRSARPAPARSRETICEIVRTEQVKRSPSRPAGWSRRRLQDGPLHRLHDGPQDLHEAGAD